MNGETRLITRDKCSGCEACKDVCPKNAITMKRDENGFYFPIIDEWLCINCGLCGKACPVEKESKFRSIEFNDNVAYGGYNMNKEELRNSSSGGFFSALAKYVLKQNGLVFGVVYKENFRRVVYSSTDEVSIDEMKGSKYVTAEKNGVYSKAKKELKTGRLVLFVGLPCEVAALYSVLGREYDNLLTCELICAGPANYNMHDAQLDWLENKYKHTTSYYSYRSKKYGWVPYCIKAINGKHIYDVMFGKTLFGIGWPYARRTACFNCWFKDKRRLADFTIGDFWRINRGVDYYNEEGTSVVFTRTCKAEALMKKLNAFKSVKVEEAVAQRGNYAQLKTHSEIPELREEYLRTLRTSGSDLSAYEKFKPKVGIKTKIKLSLPVPIYRFLRKFDNGKY